MFYKYKLCMDINIKKMINEYIIRIVFTLQNNIMIIEVINNKNENTNLWNR